MRLALLSDIHGNLLALEAVLADMAKQGAQQAVCLGDVAAFGPQPREVLQRLRRLNCPVVMGNADDELLRPEKLKELAQGRIDPGLLFELASWAARELEEDDVAFVRGFERTISLELAGLSLLAFHGSPKSFDDVITATTPDAELAAFLDGQTATVMAGGHSHTPLLRRYRGALLVNPGSVGLPFELPRGREEARNPPWAEYALLEVHAGAPSITFRRVPYDIKPLLRAAESSGMPHAGWWAQGWLR